VSTLLEEQPPLVLPTRAPHAETLAASVIILLVMTVAQRMIGFGRGILFVRWLQPEQLGEWDVAFAFLNLAGPLVVLGLPGSFGRYVEYFRQRGQFHTFLRRTAYVTAAASLIATLAIVFNRDWFSQLIFGIDTEGTLVVWLAVCLVAVILHNFLTALFIAVRMYRVVTALQFLQGLGFAAISVGLLILRPQGATSVVIGYAAASFLAALASIGWLLRLSTTATDDGAPVPQGSFWARLVPFAIWMWVTNLISNVFDLVDRYMIVHHSGMSPDEALRQVGYYHSSRIIPLLFVGVAALLASMITPHLTTDWEVGRRDAVVRRLNFVLKAMSLVLLAASVAVLFVAPALFTIGFQNKFQGGLEVLPCTLAYCAWFGVFAVAQNYLWCAERAALSSLPLVAGLVLNVALNLFWLPRYGLPGAVWATTISNLLALVLTYNFSRRHGMRVELGTWVFSLAIGALCFGPWVGLAALVAVVAAAAWSDRLFTREEKRELQVGWNHGIQVVRDLPRRLIPTAATRDV
jgi:O-antigen/teichoic acid export membrane protein